MGQTADPCFGHYRLPYLIPLFVAFNCPDSDTVTLGAISPPRYFIQLLLL